MELKKCMISGHEFHVLKDENSQVLLDTVPLAFADEWLGQAPLAEFLVLLGNDPYPKSVGRFLELHPEGIVYGTPYVIHILEGILGSFRHEWIQDGSRINLCGEKAEVSLISHPDEGSEAVINIQGVGRVPEETAFPENNGFRRILPESETDSSAAIIYVSGCDYTEMVADDICRGLKEGGADVKMIDLSSVSARDALNLAESAGCILFGSPTVKGDASSRIWEFLTLAGRSMLEGKSGGAFGAYTREGEAVPNIIERLRQLKMKVRDGGFMVQYAPDRTARDSSYEYGYDLACFLTGNPNTHRHTLVRCLVCGEIFDASLGICPVCGVGLDRCVPADEEEVLFAEDTDRRYLIVGGGTAALSAAAAVRRRDKTGQVMMITREDSIPVNRPMISKKMILVDRTPEEFLVKNAAWFKDNNVTVITGSEVTAIDTVSHMAVVNASEVMSYDRLIYAAGAECFVPPIPGVHLEGVMTVRHFRDVHELIKLKPQLKDVVVIGGGVLGLEIASELRKLYAKVTVLEAAPRIMSRQLDPETSERLVRDAEGFGVTVMTDVQTKQITGETAVEGVEIADGRVIPAQIVIISCGNRASSEVAQAAGIEVQRAVTVNNKMETSAPDVYACGDCAVLDGVNYQLWAEATEQGRVAGANAAGDLVHFEGEIYGTSFEGMNTSLFAIGDTGTGEKDYKVVEHRNGLDGSYYKYWYENGRICGGVLYKDTSDTSWLTEAVNGRISS